MADLLMIERGDGGDVLFRSVLEGDGIAVSNLIGTGGTGLLSFGGNFLMSSAPTNPPYYTDNADLYSDSGISTAVYTSLFTGAAWYDALKPSSDAIQGAGEFERLLDEPITLGSMTRIQRAAAIQLEWLKDDGVVSNVTVAVRNPAVGRIEVDISATQPNDSESRYRYMWDQREQTLVAELRNSNSLPI